MQRDAQNGEHHINIMQLPFTFWSLQITMGTSFCPKRLYNLPYMDDELISKLKCAH